jgi:nitrate reductase NapD
LIRDYPYPIPLQATGPTVTEELHIAGAVIFARPESLDSVRAHLALLPQAEVHAISPEGKIVITLEAASARQTVDYMDAIRDLPGVMNVSLVYQHAEPLAALEQEIEP